MKASIIKASAVLALAFSAAAPGASAQMQTAGMSGSPEEAFATLQSGVDMYFNEALDNFNATAQQKANAHAVIAAEAASKAQVPGILYTGEELDVLLKLRFLADHDSRFAPIKTGGWPTVLTVPFKRVQRLTDWGSRGL